jgi:hypothetical protein
MNGPSTPTAKSSTIFNAARFNGVGDEMETLTVEGLTDLERCMVQVETERNNYSPTK